MTDSEEIGKIKKLFKGDIYGLISVCRPIRQFFQKKVLLFSLIPPTLIVSLVYFVEPDNNTLLSIISDLISNGLTVVGVLLGLSLGGFILIVSYGNQALIDKSVAIQVQKYKEKNTLEFSYIQKSIGKYGLIVLFQFVVFILLIAILIIQKIGLKIPNDTAIVVNEFCIFVVSSLLFFTISLMYQLILNIFTLSQSSNFHQFVDKFSEKSH